MSQRFAQLVVFTTNTEEMVSLRKLFGASPNILVELGTGPEVSKRKQLDALWLSPMQASYLGISEPIPFDRAATFPMPQEKIAKGLPRLMIVGVALDPAREHSLIYKAKIPAQALANAILDYNKGHPFHPLLRVGSIPENLSLCSHSPGRGESGRKNSLWKLSCGRGNLRLTAHSAASVSRSECPSINGCASTLKTRVEAHLNDLL